MSGGAPDPARAHRIGAAAKAVRALLHEMTVDDGERIAALIVVQGHLIAQRPHASVDLLCALSMQALRESVVASQLAVPAGSA